MLGLRLEESSTINTELTRLRLRPTRVEISEEMFIITKETAEAYRKDGTRPLRCGAALMASDTLAVTRWSGGLTTVFDHHG